MPRRGLPSLAQSWRFEPACLSDYASSSSCNAGIGVSDIAVTTATLLFASCSFLSCDSCPRYLAITPSLIINLALILLLESLRLFIPTISGVRIELAADADPLRERDDRSTNFRGPFHLQLEPPNEGCSQATADHIFICSDPDKGLRVDFLHGETPFHSRKLQDFIFLRLLRKDSRRFLSSLDPSAPF